MILEGPYFIFYIITLVILLELYLFFGIYNLRKYFTLNKDKAPSDKKDFLPLIYGIFFICIFIERIIIVAFDIIIEFDKSNWTFENILKSILHFFLLKSCSEITSSSSFFTNLVGFDMSNGASHTQQAFSKLESERAHL